MIEQKLPADWQMVKFGEIAQHISVRKNPQLGDEKKYIGLEHLDAGYLTVKRWGTAVALKGQKLEMKKGDILFAKRNAYLKRVALAPFDGIFSAHGMVIRPKGSKIIPEYLPFFMQSDVFMDRAIAISEGSLSPTIKWKNLSEQKFTIPSVIAQEKQLSVLRQIELTQKKRTACKRSCTNFIDAMRSSFFSGECFGEKYKQTEIGDIPAHWDLVTLRQLGRWQSGGTPSKKNPSYWDGNIPWFSPKDMKTQELVRSLLNVTEDGANNGTRLVPENTIMFVVRGMILAHTFPVGITHQESTFNQDMKALQVSEEFEPRFVLHWLKANAKKFLNKVSASSHGTCRLGSEIFDEIIVPKPPISEQRIIASKLDDLKIISNELEDKELIGLRSAVMSKYMRYGD
ncbi:restriction endonuclease subunit S [Vibrio splendidus]|nr:hypothetical protein [Vibrio sp.]